MTNTFSKLAQAVWIDLGKVPPFHQFPASGGTVSTIINDEWSRREDQPEDNYCVDWTAVVTSNAGAAPEGEVMAVESYEAAARTYTLSGNLSAAVSSSCKILIANADIPLSEMYALANRALQSFGDVESVDSTLVLSSTNERYTLPAGTKMQYPIRVEYADEDGDERIPISNFKVSADGYLYIPQGVGVEGRTLYVTCVGPHVTLSVHSSAISEDIHPQLAIAATSAMAMQWINGTQGGGTAYNVQREDKALQDLAAAKVEHPVKRAGKQQRWFVAGKPDYYPGDPLADA